MYTEQQKTEELKRILTQENIHGIKIHRDKYNNVTLIKTPKNLGNSYKVGIDEAGRGPLAGPLVYGLVYWAKDPKTVIYNDSKKVKKQKRGLQHIDLYRDENVGFIIRCLSPLFISINMLGVKNNKLRKVKESVSKMPKKKQKIQESPAQVKATKVVNESGLIKFIMQEKNKDAIALAPPIFVNTQCQNLNDLSIDCILNMLSMCAGFNVPISEIFIDTVGNKKTLHEKVKNRMKEYKTIKKITVEEKADSKYQTVGAASILAKVTRDMFLEVPEVVNIMYSEAKLPSIPISGYPSDAATKNWMEHSFIPGIGFPSIFRITWKPIMDILERNKPKLNQDRISQIGNMRCLLKKAK
ncbi:ribonuclease H2 subunit A [Nematocida sp. ERTm5]|nr:ribonuclease H2 subunit A [Nematocida sp. ERTm5]